MAIFIVSDFELVAQPGIAVTRTVNACTVVQAKIAKVIDTVCGTRRIIECKDISHADGTGGNRRGDGNIDRTYGAGRGQRNNLGGRDDGIAGGVNAAEADSGDSCKIEAVDGHRGPAAGDAKRWGNTDDN
ncbi:MAG: hypothetical protein WCD00_08050, partial [Desulfuromonadaceae bacterium]